MPVEKSKKSSSGLRASQEGPQAGHLGHHQRSDGVRRLSHRVYPSYSLQMQMMKTFPDLQHDLPPLNP